MARRTAVIRLELHLADDSLTGHASDGTGSTRDFVGWMGLLSAIDTLLDGNAPMPTAPSSVSDLEGEGSS